MNRGRCLGAAVFSLALALATGRAGGAADHDFDFTSEHLPESGQDARLLGLPWPESGWTTGSWRWSVHGGYLDTGADFLTLDGPLVAVGATRGLSERWAIAGLAFYDDLQVGGKRGEAELKASFLDSPPLALPSRAEFTDPRGTMRHWGAGLEWVRALSDGSSDRPWSLFFGAVVERLELDGFAADYRLLEGADQGVTGVVDHSLRTTFVTPVVGLQQRRSLGSRFDLLPRFVAAIPLPAGDFEGRLTGPGFDLSSAAGDGSPGAIGDAVVGAGLAVRHLASGLELDLGASLFYPVFERLTHDGVDRAWVLQLSWHSPG